MRVVLLGDYPPNPRVIVGGPQAVLSYLVRGFAALDAVDLHVVALSRRHRADQTVAVPGATVHYLAVPRLPVEVAFPWLRRRVHRRLREIGPDVVHAQNARLFSWLAVESGYPAVVTAHGIHGQVHQYRSRAVDRLRHGVRDRILLGHFEDRVGHLICISPYISEGYRGRVRARMHPIENPIDDAFFALDPDRSVPGRVLFAGLLTKRKRPQLLIEAAATIAPRVPHLSVHLAGGGSDTRLQGRLRRMVNLSGLESQVTFLGHLPEDRLLREYQEMSVLVLPSDQETAPMVIQQAMAAGKPVVATRTGGVPYLVRDGETGFLVDRRDAAGLAAALETLLVRPDLAREMGRRARAEAEARFRASAVAARMLDVYRLVLAEARGIAPEVAPVGAAD